MAEAGLNNTSGQPPASRAHRLPTYCRHWYWRHIHMANIGYWYCCSAEFFFHKLCHWLIVLLFLSASCQYWHISQAGFHYAMPLITDYTHCWPLFDAIHMPASLIQYFFATPLELATLFFRYYIGLLLLILILVIIEANILFIGYW